MLTLGQILRLHVSENRKYNAHEKLKTFKFFFF